MIDQAFVNLNSTLLGALPEVLRPWAAGLVKIGVIAGLAPLIMMYLTWFERKVIARMQNRLGPDRVGIYGLKQPLADGLKMLMKEDIVPEGADKLMHTLAPLVALIPALLLFLVLPFGRNMAPLDLNIGVLYTLAVGSIGSYAVFMGGWASRSKFPVMGAMRTVAQIVSYEIPGALAVITVIMVTGTMSLVSIVEAQSQWWFVLTPWGFIGAIIFFLSGVAEVNRTPFDMPEAESELVGGFHTEYSGMKFALWYMAEFLESFAVCALTVTLFLGGWQGPAIPFWVLAAVLVIIMAMAKRLPIVAKVMGIGALVALSVVSFGEAIPSWLWFFTKTYSLMFVMVWFRGTFPRLRVDQLMGFAWKFLLPLTLVNIVIAGIWVAMPSVVGVLLDVVIALVSLVVLVKLNQPASLEKRTYTFAE